MKLFHFFVPAFVMITFSASTYAQVNSTATASVTIVTPITLAKTVDMNFGNVAVSAVAGTVVITPAPK
jgi:hypothetical protein